MRLWLALGCLAFASPAFAQSGKVKKAEKMLAKYEAGKNTSHLKKAWNALQDAREHPDTRDDARTWVRLAEVSGHYIESGEDGPNPDMWETAWKAWDTAIGKGAADDYAEPVIEALTTMETTQTAMGMNAFEGERYDDAWSSLEFALRCQSLIRQVGRLDPIREMSTVKLALLTAVALEDLDQARELHTSLADLGGRKTATTLAVARAIEAGEGPKSAEAFLAPWAKKGASDATLFGTWVGWLMELERQDDVRALLEENADQVGNAFGITLVHAQTWAELRDLDKAVAAYQQALTIDAKHQEVLRGFGHLSLAQGRDLAGQAKKARRWRDRKELRRRRDEAFMRSMALLQDSRSLEPDHLDTLVALREVFDEIDFDDKEEIAALEQAISKLEEKADGAKGTPEE